MYYLSEVAQRDGKAESSVVKKDASGLLSEEMFWKIIGDSDRGRNLKKLISNGAKTMKIL
jgi:hypothetical protein